MSNNRAFGLGIAVVFGIYVAMGVVAEIVENRVIQHLNDDGIIVGIGIVEKNINSKKSEKEGL